MPFIIDVSAVLLRRKTVWTAVRLKLPEREAATERKTKALTSADGIHILATFLRFLASEI